MTQIRNKTKILKRFKIYYPLDMSLTHEGLSAKQGGAADKGKEESRPNATGFD